MVVVVALGACGGDDGTAAEPDPQADVAVIATDNHFDQGSYAAPAGDVQFSYVEHGRIPHTLLIEDVDGFKLEVRPSDKADDGSATLSPGTYLLYCDVPGHRPSMEAELVVT